MITEVVNGKRQRTYEFDDFAVVTERYIAKMTEHAQTEDPWTLGDMTKLRDRLDTAIVATVKSLRDRDYTWNDIGLSLGISAITAHKRYADKIKGL